MHNRLARAGDAAGAVDMGMVGKAVDRLLDDCAKAL